MSKIAQAPTKLQQAAMNVIQDEMSRLFGMVPIKSHDSKKEPVENSHGSAEGQTRTFDEGL